MKKSVIVFVFACLISASLLLAASWEAPNFSDSVYWSMNIFIGKVIKVKKIYNDPKANFHGTYKGTADIQIEVVENLKGYLKEKILLTRVDLGDPATMDSPNLPLPEPLEGKNILFFLTKKDKEDSFQTYFRFPLEGDKAVDMYFDGMENKVSLKKIEAMITELLPIQKDCPIDTWTTEINEEEDKKALEACKKALESEYDDIKWYGARRLLDRKNIPTDFIESLLPLLDNESYPYLALRCFTKIDDIRAVPVLIKALKYKNTTEEQKQFIDALAKVTKQDFQKDYEKWDTWWQEYKNSHGEDENN